MEAVLEQSASPIAALVAAAKAGDRDAFRRLVEEPDAELPAAAVDTGYRTGEWSLWIDPGGDAYMVSPVTIERWPRSTDPDLGCA